MHELLPDHFRRRVTSPDSVIRVLVLGTAAGGGVPQWNCGCTFCEAARKGETASRTQMSLAVTADEEAWYLINASPDLRAQILAHPVLQPRSLRQSPLAGVIVTSPDLDHTLGCLLLREAGRAQVFALPSAREKLRWLEPPLEPFGGIEWHALSTTPAPLCRPGTLPSLRCRAIHLGSDAEKPVAAVELADEQSGKKLLIAPDVPELSRELLEAMNEAHTVFFDGTFWSEREMVERVGLGRGASQMGHLPLSAGSLAALKGCRATQKLLIHLNNTNPVLAPRSLERLMIVEAGIAVAEDGMELHL